MDKRKEGKPKQKKGKKDFLFKFDSGQYSLAQLYFHIKFYIGSDLDEDKVVTQWCTNLHHICMLSIDFRKALNQLTCHLLKYLMLKLLVV